jgi:thiol:disulfide interchange protein
MRPVSAPPIDKISGLLEVHAGTGGKTGHFSWAISAPLAKVRALSPMPAVTPSPAASPAPAFVLRPAPGTLEIFFGAFIGGLILNLMPCVLPVLSIKVLGLIKHAAEKRRTVWEQTFAFAMGVLVSFWTLAGILLALRAAGQQLGWGFQMQSPLFVMFLIALFFLFALNLLGVFEVGASLVGIDASAARQSGLLASFGTGALATLSATPCTAPFMGTALGVAVNQSPALALITFTFLGLGMASPYLILGLFPALLRFVPKPGRWMESFKQFLGFLLLGTVIFLLWVFGEQTSADSLSSLLAALLLIGLGAWIYGRWAGPARGPLIRFVACLLAALLIGIGLGFGIFLASVVPPPCDYAAVSKDPTGIAWEPFSTQRLDELLAARKPVFIDFTAAWCVNCKVNEAIALNQKEVAQAFKNQGIVALRADWTRRDATIARELARFGRSGVPLYVLFYRDPAYPPLVLPEVLTPQIVLDAVTHIP